MSTPSTTTAAAATIIAQNGFEKSVKLQFRGFQYESSPCTWHDDLFLTFEVNSKLGVWITFSERSGDYPKGDKKVPMSGYKRVRWADFKRHLEASGFKVTREDSPGGYHTVIA